MERRRFLTAAGVGVAVIGLGGPFGTAFGDSTPVEGTVEAKSVTGTSDDTSYGIVLAQEGSLSVEDERYEDAFGNWREVAVDADLERRLETEYRRLRYNVHVKHRSANRRDGVESGDSLAYRARRTLFNAVDVGDEVTFERADAETPRIRDFVTDSSD